MTKGQVSTTFYEQQRLHNIALVELVCGIPGKLDLYCSISVIQTFYSIYNVYVLETLYCIR